MAERASSHFKLVLVGNTGVGKSCLMMRFTRNEFIHDTESTVGAAFMSKVIMLEDSDVKIEIWDTAGQERYRSLAPMYYRGAQAAIVVFDVTNRESFEGAKTWVRDLQKKTENVLVIALAGNKVDLKGRVVDSEEASTYARDNGLLYVETSAKDATNVERLFAAVAARVPKASNTGRSGGVALTTPAPPSGGVCCG